MMDILLHPFRFVYVRDVGRVPRYITARDGWTYTFSHLMPALTNLMKNKGDNTCLFTVVQDNVIVVLYYCYSNMM